MIPIRFLLTFPFLYCSIYVLDTSAAATAQHGSDGLPVLTAAQRRQLRLEAETAVEKINKGQKKWKAKVNPRFAELTDEEMRRFWLGLADRDRVAYMKAKAERQAAKLGAEDGLERRTTTTRRPSTTTTTTTTTSAPDPEEEPFDAREEWPECADVISKIQDQSKCGSCWAVSAASVIQDRICISSKGKKKVDISAGDIISCEPYGDGCHGGLSSEAFAFYHSDGVVTGSNYTLKQGCKPYPIPPHASHSYETPRCQKRCLNWRYRAKKYAQDKHFGSKPVELNFASVDDIKDALFEGGIRGGPIESHMDVYNDFKHYSSGVYERSENATFLGGHAVRIIGWGVDAETGGTPYWLIANSWGTGWGENGYFRIARGQDECLIESWSVNYADPKQEED